MSRAALPTPTSPPDAPRARLRGVARIRRLAQVVCHARPTVCAATAGAVLVLSVAAPGALSSTPAHAAPPAGRPRPATHTVTGDRANPHAGPSFLPYAPGVVVVGYASATRGAAQANIARAARATDPIDLEGATHLLTLRRGASVPATLARLRHTRGVAWAVPDYIAREATLTPSAASDATASGTAQPSPAASDAALATEPFPNDPGTAKTPGGWQQLQWNFVGPFGVDAPQAWEHLIADHAPGGRGVIVAVLDTGVAYANRGPFRRSPDFYSYQFVAGYDFVAHNRHPNDRNGHGTDVAGTIAEATDNGVGLTGLAYGVRLMPVRVLNAEGNGDAATIARGVRFAVNHGARVINLSLEFPTGITASDIPELISALRYANRHRVVVVAAAGNEAHAAAAYPARAPDVIAVGASTEHGCLASYSNYDAGVTLVAPGGGPDAPLPGDPNCHPELPPGRDVFQMTFTGSSFRKFGIPNGYEGTSMATPHVAATAALIIASRVLGRHPTPRQIAARLIATARPLGGPSDKKLYGAGLLDAAAATAPGGPGAVRAG
jgi:serine protease